MVAKDDLEVYTAKEDIPDLVLRKRYSNCMNYLYNEKGPLGVGVIKGTMKIKGEPELRIVGFPVGLHRAVKRCRKISIASCR